MATPTAFANVVTHACLHGHTPTRFLFSGRDFMNRKATLWALLAAGLLSLTFAAPHLGYSDPPVSRDALKTYATELQQAFPGQVDIYIASNNFKFTEPALPNAHVIGCAQVAGMLYYVVQAGNKSEVFIPQSQVLAIHNRK